MVADVASIPGSPSDGDAVEVTDSTGIESFTPLTNIPAGFVGSSALFVRIVYRDTDSSWIWVSYGANDPESRYLSAEVNDTAAGTITFEQNIIVDGSVGIGDSSPLRSLWVNLPSDTDEVNTAWFGSGSAGFGTGLDISSNHSENLVALNASGDQAKDLVFKSGNSETMRIDTSGNVGIGTASPQVNLDVRADAPEIRIHSNTGGLRRLALLGPAVVFGI